MSITDIIPDIHGQHEKLLLALKNLGWHRRNAQWFHSDKDRQIVFLGDFIDRGPDNAATIKVVRELVDAGHARAVMGNHELNALHLHLHDPETGHPLRTRSAKNLGQNQSFLEEFPFDDPQTADVLAWFQELPLFIDDADFRAVHAYWDPNAFDVLSTQTKAGRLSLEQIIRIGRKRDPLQDIAKQFTNGPETSLPEGYFFFDKDQNERREVRLKWWQSDAKTYRDIAVSVPDPEQIPDIPLPEELSAAFYPKTDKPLFFGHYWMTGRPQIQAPNVMCLDYSAGTDGPLVSYSFEVGSVKLSLSNIRVHAAS